MAEAVFDWGRAQDNGVRREVNPEEVGEDGHRGYQKRTWEQKQVLSGSASELVRAYGVRQQKGLEDD